MKKITLSLTMLGFILGFSAAAAEDAPWYQVEIVIVKNKHTANVQELWEDSVSPLYFSQNSTRLHNNQSNFPTEEAFTKLSWQDISLSGVANRLNRSREYDVLLVTGWRQAATNKHSAKAVILEGGASITESPITSPEAYEPNYTTSSHAKEIEGTVTFHKARYHHLNFALTFKTYDARYGKAINVTLNQSRRIKLDEVNYFDHPLFGVIAKVTEYERPTPIIEDVVETDTLSGYPDDAITTLDIRANAP